MSSWKNRGFYLTYNLGGERVFRLTGKEKKRQEKKEKERQGLRSVLVKKEERDEEEYKEGSLCFEMREEKKGNE